MRKLLLRNPELFQGEKNIKVSKNYFEEWYFKNINNLSGIYFIPGINITDGNKKSFIQVIGDKYSYFIDYNISDFKYNANPFYIMIGNNYFSKDRVYIDIEIRSKNLEFMKN